MNNKKEVIVFTIVMIALLVVTIGGITFAYFASDKTTSNFNLDVSTANSMYTFVSNTNDNVDININFNEMSEATANNGIPVKSEIANINVSLTNPEEGMMTKCTYDIVWVWDSSDKYTEADVETLPYTHEATGAVYDYEFSTKVDREAETDLSKLDLMEDKKVVLKKNASISVGDRQTKIINHEIKASIYNLPVDQPNIFNKNFKAHIEIENVNCKMSDASTMKTVCPEGGRLGECIKKLGESKNAYVGDGVLIHHDGSFKGLDYANKDSLYISNEHPEYKNLDELITIRYQYYDYHLAYDSSNKQYFSFSLAAEQAVKDGYLEITESVIDANDKGYRYAGNQPNNYICFGDGSEGYNNGEEENCKPTNKYRIIGLVPVTKKDGTEENLVKIIKAEYLISDELGRTSDDGTILYNSSYTQYARIEADPTLLDGFRWHTTTNNNIWSTSPLYNSLNDDATGYLKFLYGDNEENKTLWENRIEEVKWNVGGWNNFFITPKAMYNGEMTDSGGQKTGSGTQVSAKVGLMYTHDYGYAATKDNWALTLSPGYDIDSNRQNNWLHNAVVEWAISRNSPYAYAVFGVIHDGYPSSININNIAGGVRPVLYLKSDVSIVKAEDEDGSRDKPYKISLG